MRLSITATLPSIGVALLLVLAFRPVSAQAQEATTFRRGDANSSGLVDIADPVSLLGCLFLGTACPACPDAADSNDDGKLDLSDASYTLAWLFLGGRAPPSPGPIECEADPTTDRLGPCNYDLPGCGGAGTEDPRAADVLSRMHYASVAIPEEDVELEDASEGRTAGSFPPRSAPYDPRPGPGYSWSSAVGRSYTGQIGDFAPDLEGQAHLERGSVESQILEAVGSPCVEPDYFVTAGDRSFVEWPGTKFQAPAKAFATKNEALQFLTKVHAEQPFFLPYTDPDVKLGHGWYYSGDKGLHRGCDYSRGGVEENEDSTFKVVSAGWGKVAAVVWDGNSGNTVLVEHTAPGGQKIMVIYMHLRNGRSHDIAKALSSTSTDEKYVKYRAFATGYPDHLSWGTEGQKIKVSVGDDLAPGDEIALAGNTGAGGAGSGLNADGSPKNWKGNVHLHTYFAVPHPTTANVWVWVDPYGVYNKVDTGCYDLLKDTQFSRLYAPFYPTFHGVPYEVFSFYFGYYPDMGWKLRTLSLHRKDSNLLVSGSFQGGIPGGWYVHGYMTPESFQQKADAYWQQGYIPRETSVAKTLSGSPRYTAIWRHLEAGEAVEHRAELTSAQWQAKWDDRVVEDEWRLEDYCGYAAGNATRHSVLVTSKDGRPFIFSGLKSSAELDALIDEYKQDGFLPVSMNVAELASGKQYSAIFRKLPGFWKVFWGRTPSEYQSLVGEQVALGYGVWKVQGYANSGRYAVVFHRE